MHRLPLISIIVPIYNIEHYVQRCLESLSGQTYPNYEVLMVDDGSTDCSAEICREFEKRFTNMQLLKKENGGLSDARNFGIEHAHGSLIALVDGDDYVENNFLEVLFNSLRSSASDIAVCSYALVTGDTIQPFQCDEEVLSGIDAMKRVIARQRLIDVVAWNKLYRKEVFTGNRYPVDRLHEDVFTTYRLFASAKRVSYINAPAYHYVMRESSIMGSMSSRRLEVLAAGREMAEFCCQRGIAAEKEIEAFDCVTRATLLSWIAESPQRGCFEDSFCEIQKGLSIKTCISNSYVGLTHTAIAIIGRFGMRALGYAVRLRRAFASK